MAGINWLDKLFSVGLSAVIRVFSGGSQVTPARGAVEFKGSGVVVADNPTTNRTDITIAGPTGHSATNAPPAIGAAGATGSVTTRHALEDHTHAHGNQLGGALHADVSEASSGFMTSLQRSELITAKATTDALDTARTVARVAGDPAAVANLALATVIHAPRGTKTIAGTATLAAAIETAQAAGYHVELIAGDTYVWEKRIDFVDGLRIFCTSKAGARITSGFTNADGADTDVAYIGRARSIIGSQVGVHHARAYGGGRYAVWDYNPTVGATFLLVTGDPSVDALSGYYDQQLKAGDYVRQLVRVKAATSIGGGDYRVEFDRPLVQSHWGHASTTPTTKVYAVTTTFEELHLENIYFDLAGSTHAVGILAENVRRVRLKNVHVSGGSRAAIRISGSGRSVDLDITHHGGTNCAVMLDSPTGRVQLDSVEGGDRCHASGIPRGLVTVRGNGSMLRIRDSYIAHGCTGISLWGGVGLFVASTLIFDCDPTARASRDPAVQLSPVGSRPMVAGGIDQNGFLTGTAGTLKAYDIVFDDVDVINCGGIPAGAATEWPSVLICDAEHITGSRLGIHASGGGTNGTLAASPNYQPLVLGMLVADAFRVTLNQFDCFGVHMPIMFSSNGATKLHIRTMNVHNRDAYTSIGCWFASLEDNDGVFHVDQLNVMGPWDGYFAYSMHGGTPQTTLMQRVRIGRFTDIVNGLSASRCRFYKATASGAVGQRWEAYSNAGVRSIRAPTDTRQDNKVFPLFKYGSSGTAYSFASGDWVLCAEGDELMVASSEDPLLEAVMVAGTTTDVIEWVPGAPFAPVGTVKRRKTTVQSGVSLIGVARSGAVLPGASAAATANTLALRGTAGELAVATLIPNDITFPASEASPTISQTVAAAGAGVPLALRAQPGAAGSADGALIVGQDNGASDASGPVRIVAGQVGAVAGRSAYTSWAQTDVSTPWLDVYRYAGSIATVHAGGTDHLYLASSYKVWVGIGPYGAGFPYLDVDQSSGGINLNSSFVEFTGHRACPPTTLARTGTLTCNLSNGDYFQAGDVDLNEELTGGITWAQPTNSRKGVELTIRYRGDGTQTVAWNAAFKFGSAGNAQPASPAVNDTVYTLIFKSFDGAVWECVSSTSRGG